MRSLAIGTLPLTARRSLITLGHNLALARKKRRLSTVSMSERSFVSRTTLAKIEKGDPSVSIGAYASVLAILGLEQQLGEVAHRTKDSLGLDIDEKQLPKRIRTRRRKAGG